MDLAGNKCSCMHVCSFWRNKVMSEASLLGFQVAEIGAAICTVTSVVIVLVIAVLVVKRFLK